MPEHEPEHELEHELEPQEDLMSVAAVNSMSTAPALAVIGS
jgi:hypothetical protein